MACECADHTLCIEKTHKHVHHTQINHTTLDIHIKNSQTRRLVLAMTARDQHFASKDLRTSSDGATDGEDITLGFPQRIPLTNSIKIDTTIM